MQIMWGACHLTIFHFLLYESHLKLMSPILQCPAQISSYHKSLSGIKTEVWHLHDIVCLLPPLLSVIL